MWARAYKHHLPPQLVLSLQEVSRQDHPRGPELAPAPIFEVLVQADGRGEEAGEGEGGGAGGFGRAGG